MNPLIFLALTLAGAPPSHDSTDALRAQLEALVAEPSPVALPLPVALPPTAKTLTLKHEESSGILPGVGAGVLVAAMGAALWLKRKKRNGDGLGLCVLQTASLGRGRELMVVQHGGRRILLGVTDHGIAVLGDHDAPLAPPLPATPAAISDERTLAPGVALFERELEQRLAGDAVRREPLNEDDALRRKMAARRGGRGAVS